MKLSKEKTYDLLDKISEDNEEYGLVFKLCYVYGRLISEIYSLDNADVDFDEDKITFTINNVRVDYPLHSSVKIDLKRQVNETSNYLFQHIAVGLDNFASRLNYYLKKWDSYCGVHITPRDFKRLRGQHLVLDGVPIGLVQELFRGRNISSTKRFIGYEDLLDIKDVDSLEDIFCDYTMGG